MRGALHVSELRGDRWNLALDLLRSGEGAADFDGVCMYREVRGPQASGRIQIELLTQSIRTGEAARTLVLADRQSAVVVLRGDPRLTALVLEYGADWSIVFDDNNTRVLLERLDPSMLPST